MVDFGRELYTAWRLSEGDVLYREVDSFYGPLSQYLNAAAFYLFGTGLTTLIAMNLIVFAGIVATLYGIVRRGWDTLTALTASSVFIAVFGFSRFSKTGSFNYIAPYSHEVTHGLLILLLLLGALLRWRSKPDRLSGFAVGALAGLTLVLKPEISFAAGAVCLYVAAVGAFWRKPDVRRTFLAGMVGFLLPTLVFAVYFSAHFPARDALSAAGRAWWNVVGTSRFVSDPAQLWFMGINDVWPNAWIHLRATAFAVLVLAGIGLTSHLASAAKAPRIRLGLSAALVGAVGVLASFPSIDTWIEVGRCFAGISLLYLVASAFQLKRFALDGNEERRLARQAFCILSLALMARMILNGRIYQFGFYQAALAGAFVVAFFVGEFPRLLSAHAAVRVVARLAAVVLIAGGTSILFAQNVRTHRLVVQPVSAGSDRFYSLAAPVVPAAPLISELTRLLSERPPGEKLLPLPEGLMINYLTRRKCPLPHFFYYSVVTAGGAEVKLVETLDADPPEWVMLLPRDLTEYEILEYGADGSPGALLLGWVRKHYASVGRVDGAPIDYFTHGVELLRRKHASP